VSVLATSRQLRFLGFAFAAALTVAACGSTAGDTARPGTSDEPASNPREIDSLVIATSFAIGDIDPADNGFWAPEFGFGALLMKPLGGGELEPWLLETIEQPSPTTWDLTLRQELTFHNGAPLDASALAAVMNFHLAENGSVRPLLEGAEATVLDDTTVTLTTAEPTVYVPSLLAHESMFPIFDLAAYEATADRPGGLIDARIWSGPYVVTALDADRMDLVPFDGWFDGPPQLADLSVRFIPDAEARILAVRTGEVDLALYPPTATARELEGRDDALYLTQPPGTADSGFQLQINLREAPLDDVAVRQALRDAIDYQAIATAVMDGLYDPALSLYPPSLPYAVENQITDVEAANRTLDDAGWVVGSDGVRSKDGTELSITLLSYPQQPDSGTIAVAVQSMLAEVGFDVQVEQVDDVEATLEQATGWNAAVVGNGMLDWTASDPITPLVDGFTPSGERNYSGTDDDELTALIDQLRTTFDEAERNELLADVQRIMVDEQVYTLYLALKRVPVVASPRAADYVVPQVALLFVDAYS
jgi:peptide/nickel transport system substrate-binding protein